MNVLLVSASVSKRLQDELYGRYGISTGFAIQKYYRLLEEGLNLNGAKVEELSIVPVSQASAPFVLKRFKSEKEDGVSHRYLTYLKYASLYHPLVLISLFFRVLWWSLRNRKGGLVICDILIPSVCIGTALGSALGGCRRLAWVTDMPGITSDGKGAYEQMGLLTKLQIKSIQSFSGFIFSTRQSNDRLNVKKRPYAVVEGFVSPAISAGPPVQKSKQKVVLYAGGLKDEYGIIALCEAVAMLKHRDDLRLIIYGSGPSEGKIKEYAKADSRIDYRGTAINEVIVKAEKEALLLVNPRFTGAEYTLYSYPSKNIEYMVSGTPLVTTRLAGIPEDHYPYLYTFDTETAEGYAATLDSLLAKPEGELKEFGQRAAEYIRSAKASDVQVRKILNIL